MKNRSSKIILVFFALGLLSCALCVQQAQAVPVTGAITFAGGVELDTGSAGTATQVTGWLDEGGNMPEVQSRSGVFIPFVSVGDSVTFTPFPWSFNTSVAIPMFWQVDGFTFNLIASNIVFQGPDSVSVAGTGTISGNGFSANIASWSFSTQDPSSNGVFSFSGGSQAPDGGATVALLGLALAGIEGIRRKLRNAKS